MITLTVTYQMPADQHAFEQAHFAGDAWAALHNIDKILHETYGNLDKLDAVRDVLADVLWRVD